MKTLLALFMIIILLKGHVAGSEREENLHFGRFGEVIIYRNTSQPTHVVLFVSGDGGWNLGVVDMAKALAENDALVVGIDITVYLKQLENSNETCLYPAADFEMLSKFVQKKIGFPVYRTPVLVGYSSGATLVYALLGQAPPGTFRGAMSLGFCPDLGVNKPFCKGFGLEWRPGSKGKGSMFMPVQHLQEPWIAFQGTIDQVCDPAATEKFVKQVNNGKTILLPKVGHGFSVQKNWMPQFKAAFGSLMTGPDNRKPSVDPNLSDLPLIELPVEKSSGDRFVVMVTGDGGWAGIDREIGAALVGKGVPVIGLNALAYFWTSRTPEGTARDLSRIIGHYRSFWKKKEVILVGYSLGANVIPFMINRLPKENRKSVSGIVLIGPSRTAAFEFHISDWFGSTGEQGVHQVLPEVEKLEEFPLLCFMGSLESDSLCHDVKLPKAKIIILTGGHHLGGDYGRIAQTILSEIK